MKMVKLLCFMRENACSKPLIDKNWKNKLRIFLSKLICDLGNAQILVIIAYSLAQQKIIYINKKRT